MYHSQNAIYSTRAIMSQWTGNRNEQLTGLLRLISSASVSLDVNTEIQSILFLASGPVGFIFYLLCSSDQ